MRTSICTCCTSFVMRVISDGAPNRFTSWAENPVTCRNRSRRTSRPNPMETRDPRYTAPIEKPSCTAGHDQHHHPEALDVAGVAPQHALVDHRGVQIRKVERRQGLHPPGA